jgi:hypothetical protein
LPLFAVCVIRFVEGVQIKLLLQDKHRKPRRIVRGN